MLARRRVVETGEQLVPHRTRPVLNHCFSQQAKPLIEDGMHPQTIIRGYRIAQKVVLDKLRELAVDIEKTDEGYASWLYLWILSLVAQVLLLFP